MAKSAQNTSVVAFMYHRLSLIARHSLCFRMMIESIDYYLTCLGSLTIFWRTLKGYTPLHKKLCGWVYEDCNVSLEYFLDVPFEIRYINNVDSSYDGEVPYLTTKCELVMG